MQQLCAAAELPPEKVGANRKVKKKIDDPNRRYARE